MIKIANNLVKLADANTGVKAKDISFGDPDYPGHVIADYLYGVGAPLTSHAIFRSDVFQSLAEAANIPSEDVSWSLKHPMLSQLGGILGGGALGAGAGIGIGALGDEPEGGGVVGGIGGALLGGLLTTLSRRNAMKDIASKFDTAESLKEMTPENNGFLDNFYKGITGVNPYIRNKVINQINYLKNKKAID
jgi:hypothetical protein